MRALMVLAALVLSGCNPQSANQPQTSAQARGPGWVQVQTPSGGQIWINAASFDPKNRIGSDYASGLRIGEAPLPQSLSDDQRRIVNSEEARIERLAGQLDTSAALSEAKNLMKDIFAKLLAARRKPTGEIALEFRDGDIPLIQALGRRVLVSRKALETSIGQDDLVGLLALEIVLIDVDDAQLRYQRPIIAVIIDAHARQRFAPIASEADHQRGVQEATTIVIGRRLDWSRSEASWLVQGAGYNSKRPSVKWNSDTLE